MVVVALGVAFSAAAQSEIDPVIAHPIWLVNPTQGALPHEGFPIADYHMSALLRCRVAQGALVHCTPAEPMSEAFGSAAVAATASARVAPTDNDGLPTEGRTVMARVGFPLIVLTNAPAVTPSSEPLLTGLVWIERPSPADFAANLPPRARADHIEGRATLDCIVDGEGRVACTVFSEEPRGYGFGEAALRLSRKFRMAPQTSAGAATAGGKVHIPLHWSAQ
jgi:TonB family protein